MPETPQQNQEQQASAPQNQQAAAQPTAEKKGMSTGAKVALGIGGCCILIIIVFVALIAFGVFKANDYIEEYGSSVTDEVSDLQQTYQDEFSDAANNTVEYQVGETVSQSNFEMTVNEVEFGYTSNNEFDVPEDGNEYVRVNVTIENQSDTALSYSSADFLIQDSSGNRQYTAFVSGLANELDFGELAAGGSVTGNLVFEAAQNDENLKLVYNSTLFGEDIIVEL